MRPESRRYALEAALVATAAVWGGTFVMVKDAVAQFPVFSFLAWRFAIASVAFVVLFPAAVRLMDRATLRTGLVAAAFLIGGYGFQTWALQSTSASNAAFITGMFVVITPILQFAVLRRAPHFIAVGGIAMAVAGLWLLTGSALGGWNPGDVRALICAALYSGHIIVLGSMGRRHDVRPLTLVQLVAGAGVCAVLALPFEGFRMPETSTVWVALVVTGVLATAVAFWVQTSAQKLISPTRTALILVSEPAFGGLFGYLAGERLSAQGWVGAALILGGMVMSEALSAVVRGTRKARLHIDIEGPPVPDVEDLTDTADQLDRV